MNRLTKFIGILVVVWVVGLWLTPSQVAADLSVTTTLPHKTDFLTLSICGSNWCGTTWYPINSSRRTEYRNLLKQKGYTHLYLSVTSDSHDYFSKSNGANEFRDMLKVIKDDGLKPVVWLTSDTGAWRNKSISAIKADLSNFIPVIDVNVNSYVVGLEANEYWTKSETAEIGNHLDGLTEKPLTVHQQPGRWDFCKGESWCDYMIVQLGTSGLTTSFVKEKVTQAINELGKPVVAGEYNLGGEATSISLGNAAQEACAAGFGNGGTPSAVKWPGCSGSVTITPTPGGWRGVLAGWLLGTLDKNGDGKVNSLDWASSS